MVHDKSVAELRAMVKARRKESVRPPSKMKKHELIAELEKQEERVLKIAEQAVEKVDVPVVKKAEKAIKALHKKEMAVEMKAPEVAVKSIAKAETGTIPKAIVPPAKKMGKGKVTESVVAQVKQDTSKMPVKKLIAGSQEARDRMSAIRAMRKAKTESVE